MTKLVQEQAGDVNCVLWAQDGTTQTVNCEWFDLCALGPVCNCTATGCAVPTQPEGTPPNQYALEIDGALDPTGTTLTGTMSTGRVTVILTRQD